jgi:hypothetical protein
MAQVDETGKVDPSYQELRRRKAAATAAPADDPPGWEALAAVEADLEAAFG